MGVWRRPAAATVVLVLGAVLGMGSPQTAAATDASIGWMHVLYTVGDLAARPPEKPLVVLLGGSVARESTVSDASWAAQVLRRGGPPVLTCNLSSRSQTFAEDVWLASQLPRVPAVVFIGINVGRFTSSPSATFVTVPSPYSTYREHRYSVSRILSVERKRGIVRDWMKRRYPTFTERYSYNLRQLDRCLQSCLARGLHPVLLDLPRNRAIIGHAWDAPVKRYQADMRRLADKYAVRFVNCNSLAKLADRDFFDLSHLVEPGRAKWQRLLSDRTITLLAKYGMGTAIATSAATSTPVAVFSREGKGGTCSAPSQGTWTTRSSGRSVASSGILG